MNPIDRSDMANDKYEYYQGYELGCEDCTRQILPRFRMDHSDFAIGYADGYVNHVQFLESQGKDYEEFEE